MPKPRQVRAVQKKRKPRKPAITPVRIGIVAGEPIRVEGLRSIFDLPATPGHPPLVPVVGPLSELLADKRMDYLVVDLNSAQEGLETLQAVRRSRPAIKQIVIGPVGDDELVLDSIVAGARAYLDSSASPETVHMAIDMVVDGSIWAPRRLLSLLIDRLLSVPRNMVMTTSMHLTEREQQVLELIMLARPNGEIARQLGIGERTVKFYVGQLLKKTGAENRIDLSMRAMSRSLVPRKSGSAGQ